MRVPWRRRSGGVGKKGRGPHGEGSVWLTPGERSLLRSARERRGYTVEQLAEAMDVRPRYVSALERGELESELSLPYVRNMVAHYALHVGLDPAAFLLGGDEAEPSLEPPEVTGHPRSGVRGSRAGRHLVVASLTVALLVAGFFAAMQIGVLRGAADGGPRQAASPSTVPPSTVPPTSVTSTTLPPAVATSTTATSTTLPAKGPAAAAATTTDTTPVGAVAQAPFLVRFRPMGEVWMEVTDEAGGTILFSGNRQVDDVLELRHQGPLVVVVGRPEAVKVSIDRVVAKAPSSQHWRVTKAGIESLD